jgi:serine phosphatase RsbU (regulator of sigma subunit)
VYSGVKGALGDVIPNETTGLPLGVMPGFEYEAVTIPLEPGDTLTVFTDGVTDSLNPTGEMFGLDRVEKFITPDESDPTSGRPERTGERLVAAVRKHAGNRPQNDDIAVVCFGRLEPAHGPAGGATRPISSTAVKLSV